MKPSKTAYPSYTTTTKKKPAKRRNCPTVQKLLELKYRINDYKKTLDDVEDCNIDKTWVMERIQQVRDDRPLVKWDMEKCNELWRKYD